MSDAPKFEVIDRRKFKAAEEEQEAHSARSAESEPEAAKPAPDAAAGHSSGPRLVVSEPKASPESTSKSALAESEPASPEEEELGLELPPLPSAEEVQLQKAGYEASAQRLEELIRAQNPAMGPQPAVTFPHLVQQFYVSAMIQMGASAQEGQRPRVDILGAKGTIDLLNILAEKTRGNLTPAEDRALQTVLHEVRIAFNELVSMINLQAMQPPPAPPPGKR
jgi:Domain of unknown function (DUF1844)